MDWLSELPFLVYFIVSLSFILLVKRWMSRPVNIPPCPRMPLPLVGHLLYFGKDTRDLMSRWAHSTGDMMSMYFGNRLVIFLNGYDVVQQVFVKSAKYTSDRPDTLRGDLLSDDHTTYDEKGRYIGKGLAAANSYLWKEQKTVLLYIFREFGVGKNLLAHKVQDEASMYVEALANLKGKATDVHLLTSTVVANVVSSVMVGERFDYDDEYFVSFMDKVNDYLLLLASNTLFVSFKWLGYLPGDLFKAKKRLDIYNFITEKFVKVYIDKAEKEYDENHINSFIAGYLREMKKLNAQGTETTLNRENLTVMVFEMFAAGTETTTSTLLWFYLYMQHCPKVQAKIYQEICDVVGTQRLPTMQDKPNLTYLNAAIQETLRLASIVPFGLEHITLTDLEVNGYTIPSGTSVFANYDHIFQSPKLWENPLDFSPERFLDADGNFINREELTPFSTGRRTCPGKSMAEMELFLVLTNIVQKFEILPETPGVVPPREPLLGLTCPPKNFKVRFVER